MVLLNQVFHDVFGDWAAADVAVADEKYFYHCGFSSFIELICRVLRRFARFIFLRKIVKNITVSAKRGKMRRIEAVKRSQNVVKGGVFYYSGYLGLINYFS